MKLSNSETLVLRALAHGWTLKSHRHLDGSKEYRLHPLDEEPVEPVAWETVERLRERGLIDSNKKFPAATYLLTGQGRRVAARMGDLPGIGPLTARGWH